MPASNAPLHIGKLPASGSRHDLSTPDKTMRAHAVRELQKRMLRRRLGEDAQTRRDKSAMNESAVSIDSLPKNYSSQGSLYVPLDENDESDLASKIKAID